MNEPKTETKTIAKVPNPPVGLPRILPHLFYNDLEAAIDWLSNAFDFKVRVRMGDKEGKIVHGELEVVDSLIMLGLAPEHEHWTAPNKLEGKIHQRMFIFVENIDAHFERAKAAGATINIEPRDTWHGERVYEVIDPEGHYWKFSEPIFEIDQHHLQRPQ